MNSVVGVGEWITGLHFPSRLRGAQRAPRRGGGGRGRKGKPSLMATCPFMRQWGLDRRWWSTGARVDRPVRGDIC